MTREGSVTAHDGVPPVSGGSIPAPSLHFWLGENEVAKALIEQFHYSKRWPPEPQLVITAHLGGGLFGNKGDAVAAAVFGPPAARWGEPVWELSRLVRHDDVRVPLTALIAMGCRKARAQGIDLVVSYADTRHGHHGGVYQAAGWNYSGTRVETSEGLVVNGIYTPRRTAHRTWGTTSVPLLAKQGVFAVPRSGMAKHLYWRALTKPGHAKASRLGLGTLEYPKQPKA